MVLDFFAFASSTELKLIETKLFLLSIVKTGMINSHLKTITLLIFLSYSEMVIETQLKIDDSILSHRSSQVYTYFSSWLS